MDVQDAATIVAVIGGLLFIVGWIRSFLKERREKHGEREILTSSIAGPASDDVKLFFAKRLLPLERFRRF